MSKVSHKCIFLDLDNTLWGGIIGESDIQLILLDKDGNGKPYFGFQKELVKLHKQGVLLAVCSKNNTCDALDVIEEHPDMLIRPSMISSFRINWDNKALNIVSIAKELNIGLDSIMFIDDNPSERALVRETLPEIEVFDLPENPVLYATALRECSRFWPIQLTKDDLHKHTYFSMDRLRRKSMDIGTSIDDFLRSSKLKVKVQRANKESLPRITQLINKTNQFNITTHRYTQVELEKITVDSKNYLLCMEMSDKFGEYGIIGVALIKETVLDLFLLSCRALGKDAEIAFLSYIMKFMKDKGERDLTGVYIPSPKNAQTISFYKDTGFILKETVNGKTIWNRNLSGELLPAPDWFEFL